MRNALERLDLQLENQRFRDLVGAAPKIIGRSGVLQHVISQATQVAKSDASVLLTGESGTGKELFAAHIHRESRVASIIGGRFGALLYERFGSWSMGFYGSALMALVAAGLAGETTIARPR